MKTLGTLVLLFSLTALAGAEDRHRALEAGFQVHLAKPVDIDRILSTLAKVLDSRKSGGDAQKKKK